MRIAVISDVHSAAGPFRTALSDARSEGFDQLILLGDLFTYGVDPGECLDLALEAIEDDDALFVGGNHDQLYIDLGTRRSSYLDQLPDWIRESVEWTWSELGERWPAQLESIPEWAWGTVLFAHANPFGYGNWTYLADEDRLEEAAVTLRERGFGAGIFGHLHRPKYHRDAFGTEVHVVNSIGQPRSKTGPGPSWTMVSIDSGNLALEARPVSFDAQAHCSNIAAVAGLSAQTKSRLCGFYQ